MTDYTKTTNFTAKDNLTTGDPLKVIKGSYFDTEFDDIATAVATKYDSDDLASQAEAEGEASTSKLITPERLGNWSDANGGLVGEIHALADPNADGLLGWDDSAGADANVVFFTMGTGLGFNGTTIEMSHLGLEDLADPNADRALFWDDSAGNLAWGTLGNGLEISGTTLGIADVSASTTQAIKFTSGTPALDIESLTNIEGNAVAATDRFLVYDVSGNVPKAITYRDMGLVVQLSETGQTLALGDMNTIMEFNAAATVTLPTNAAVAIPVGSFIIIVVDHASSKVTVTADTGVNLNSIYHPGGTDAASDKVLAGGTAIAIKTATNDWYLSGDIVDS